MGINYHLFNKKKRVAKSTVLLLCTILFVEISQYVLSTGSFDIDDIMLNAVGGAVGIGICRIIYILCKQKDALTRYVVSMASILVVPLLFFIVLQEIMWFSIVPYGIISIFAVIVWDVLVYRLCRHKEHIIKKAYWGLASVFILMYLFLALPQVSPSFFLFGF